MSPLDTSPEGMVEFNKETERRKATGVAAPEEDRPLYVEGLNHPRRCETITDALLKRGYSERVAEKVLGLNFVNALTEIWR
jgi:membrane dipeptidase